jgi:hypothetical protein
MQSPYRAVAGLAGRGAAHALVGPHGRPAQQRSSWGAPLRGRLTSSFLADLALAKPKKGHLAQFVGWPFTWPADKLPVWLWPSPRRGIFAHFGPNRDKYD